MADSTRAKLDEEVNEKVQAAVKEIEEIEKEMEHIQEEFDKEQAKFHWNFEKKKFPIYEKRAKVIAQIPKFWLTAMSNHPALTSYIQPDDEDLLGHLTDLKIEQRGGDSLSSVKFIFSFKPNPYFENAELIREFEFEETSNLSAIEPPPIRWKPGKKLTEVKPTKGKKRRHEETTSSFFSWFEKEMESNEEELTTIANTLLDDLWPNALKWYQGDDEEEEEEAGEEEEGDEEGEGEGQEEGEGEGEGEEGEEEGDGEEGGDEN